MPLSPFAGQASNYISKLKDFGKFDHYAELIIIPTL